MRNILFASLLFVFTHCQTTNSVAPDKTLTGRWVWVQSSGGFAGTTNTPASTKQTIEIEFTTDSHQKLYINGQLSSDMAYHIIRDTSIYTGKQADMIEYDNSQSRKTYSFEDGNLILADECFDCFTSKYSRKTTGTDN